MKNQQGRYRFSCGPWCFDTGRDPFGSPVREEFTFTEMLKLCRELDFEGIQLHDDDVVPNINQKTHSQIMDKVREVKKIIDGEGLETEFIAPKLWEDEHTIDGSATSNNANDRKYAFERSKKAIDIANVMGTKRLVFFLGREGTYIREAKDPKRAIGMIVEFINELLQYDKNILILGETKPNEPMDQIYCPTAGHFIGITYKTIDPARVGVYIETAHCIMSGLDPADEMGYALWHDKLWGVHLDDQNGMKFNEHRTFGAVNLRQAFNQVDVLERHGYGLNGEFVGLETRALRTQSKEKSYEHLRNSRDIFLKLLEIVRTIDQGKMQEYIEARNYEGLEMYILKNLMRF